MWWDGKIAAWWSSIGKRTAPVQASSFYGMNLKQRGMLDCGSMQRAQGRWPFREAQCGECIPDAIMALLSPYPYKSSPKRFTDSSPAKFLPAWPLCTRSHPFCLKVPANQVVSSISQITGLLEMNHLANIKLERSRHLNLRMLSHQHIMIWTETKKSEFFKIIQNI